MSISIAFFTSFVVNDFQEHMKRFSLGIYGTSFYMDMKWGGLMGGSLNVFLCKSL